MTAPVMPAAQVRPAQRSGGPSGPSDSAEPFATALDGALSAPADGAARATPSPRGAGRPQHPDPADRGVGRGADNPGRRIARGRADADQTGDDTSDAPAGGATAGGTPASLPSAADAPVPPVDPSLTALPLWAMASAVVVPAPPQPAPPAAAGNGTVGGVDPALPAALPTAPAPAAAPSAPATPAATPGPAADGAATRIGFPVLVPPTAPGSIGQPAAGAAPAGAGAAGAAGSSAQPAAPVAVAFPAGTGVSPVPAVDTSAAPSPVVTTTVQAVAPQPAVPAADSDAADSLGPVTGAAVPVAPTAGTGNGTGTGTADTGTDGSGSDADRGDDLAAPAAPGAAALSAPAPAAPVTAPVAAATAPAATAAPVASQLVPHVAVLRGAPDGSHSMTVVLSPENLGPVQLQVTLTNGTLDMTLRGAHEHGRSALMAALPDLRRDLQAAGLSCSKLDVDAEAGGSWSAQHQSAQQQAAQQQSGEGRGWAMRSENARPRGRSAELGQVRPIPVSSGPTSSGVDFFA